MKKHSVRFRTILGVSCFLLVLVPILLVSLFAGLQTARIVQENMQQTVRGLFEQGNRQLISQLEEVEAVYSSVTLDGNLVDAIRLENTQSTVYQRNTHLQYISRGLKNLLNGRTAIDNIVLYTPQGNILVAAGAVTMPYREQLPDEGWFQALKSGVSERYTQADYPLVVAKYPRSVTQPVVISARRVYDYRDSRYLGLVVVTVRTDTLFQTVDNLPLPDTGEVAILDGEGALLHARGLSRQLRSTLAGDWRSALDGDGYLDAGGSTYFLVSQTIDMLGWQLISVTPRAYIMKSVDAVWTFSLRVALAVSALCAALVFFLTRGLSRSIGRIALAIERFGSGRLDVRLRAEPYTEFEQVRRQFNHMAGQIDALTGTVRENEREKQLLNMRMLEAQINPHFIYNTLDAVKWVAMMHGDRESARMLTSLVKLLRVSVYTKSEFITVAEELEYLENYLTLIRLRYGTQITFVYDIDEAAKACLTLKLVLQPIVENAIFHGLLGKAEHGVVTVRYRAGELLWLEVEDNGIGYVPEQPQEKARERFSGIGLDNIDRRIRIWSGEAYGVHIVSEPGKGTCVRVTQPRRTEEGKA